MKISSFMSCCTLFLITSCGNNDSAILGSSRSNLNSKYIASQSKPIHAIEAKQLSGYENDWPYTVFCVSDIKNVSLSYHFLNGDIIHPTEINVISGKNNFSISPTDLRHAFWGAIAGIKNKQFILLETAGEGEGHFSLQVERTLSPLETTYSGTLWLRDSEFEGSKNYDVVCEWKTDDV